MALTRRFVKRTVITVVSASSYVLGERDAAATEPPSTRTTSTLIRTRH